MAETPEERMQDTLYKQMLAKRAVEQAIYESRLAIAMRGKKPETDRTKIQVGQQIEVFVKPDKKDVSGWRRPCTVISIDTAGNIEYRWQGVIRKTPTHLTRPMAQDLGIFSLSSESPDLLECEELRILMEHTERFTICN